MSRSLRLLYKNAWYHVMNRGASRAKTFFDREDFQIFIDLLSEVNRRYCFEIHAYCLMPNHYHLLIKTPLSNLSDGMRHLNSLYTRHHNKKHGKDGALFRGRYKAVLVEAENYLLRVSRYIHLNPVKACLTKHPSKYHWSSYQFYSKNIEEPEWLYTSEILAYFSDKQQKNKYSLFVMEKTDKELEIFYRKAKLLPILGSETFCKQIGQTLLADMPPKREIPDQKNIHIRPDLLKICELVAKYYRVPIKQLYTVIRKKGNLPRMLAIYLAAELSGKKFGFIANFFTSISATGVSQIILRIKKQKFQNNSISYDIAALTDLIRKG